MLNIFPLYGDSRVGFKFFLNTLISFPSIDWLIKLMLLGCVWLEGSIFTKFCGLVLTYADLRLFKSHSKSPSILRFSDYKTSVNDFNYRFKASFASLSVIRGSSPPTCWCLLFEVNFSARWEFIKHDCISSSCGLRYLHLREPHIFEWDLSQWIILDSNLNWRHFILGRLGFNFSFWKRDNICKAVIILVIFNLFLYFCICEILQDLCLTSKYKRGK